MLIRFSIENFRSFRERVYFSMLPGKGRLKKGHISSETNGIRTLKTSVVFGANASGKSNLIKAIDFGRKLVIRGNKNDELLSYKTYKFNSDFNHGNSRIEYEIQHAGKNYAYGFVFNNKLILEEWLYEITKTSEKKIFERINGSENQFDLAYLHTLNRKVEHKQFLDFTAKGTPENVLFLHEIRNRRVQENVEDISPLLNVYDWFQNTLKVIFPNDKYDEGIKYEAKEDSKLQDAYEKMLRYFNTDIDGICLQEVNNEKVDIPSILLNKIKEDLLAKKTENTIATLSNGNTTYFFSKKNENDILLYKFMTKHYVEGLEEPILFDTKDESDGTNRIIDFIPLIIDLLKGGNVFIIDEMERSLHPNLIYDIVDLFLEQCENIDSQLIIASHESSIITQKLLRKDEIWFAIKEKNATKLQSLEEYSIRFDKEVRKDYLLGRYKGVPKLGSRKALNFLNMTNS